MDFDKTDDLRDFVVRLNAVEVKPFLRINLTAPNLEKFLGENSEIIKILLFKLGASLTILSYNDTPYALGGIGPNGTYEGMLAPVSDGRVDLGMNTRSLLVLWKVKYVLTLSKQN